MGGELFLVRKFPRRNNPRMRSGLRPLETLPAPAPRTQMSQWEKNCFYKRKCGFGLFLGHNIYFQPPPPPPPSSPRIHPCSGGLGAASLLSAVRQALTYAIQTCHHVPGQVRRDQMGLGCTGSNTGHSWFLLSSGCDRRRYYSVTQGTGPIPNETQLPCQTLLAGLMPPRSRASVSVGYGAPKPGGHPPAAVGHRLPARLDPGVGWRGNAGVAPGGCAPRGRGHRSETRGRTAARPLRGGPLQGGICGRGARGRDGAAPPARNVQHHRGGCAAERE